MNPLHLSDGRSIYYSSQERLHSDTIKNAIYVSAAKLIGDEVYQDPGFYDSFRVSSAFPFFMDEFFLPVSQLRPHPCFWRNGTKAGEEDCLYGMEPLREMDQRRVDGGYNIEYHLFR